MILPRRIDVMLEVLHVLSEHCESYTDAQTIIRALYSMDGSGHLVALWRANEAPATTREALAAIAQLGGAR